MLRQPSVNSAIISMAVDIALTLLALFLAAILRPFLPLIPFFRPLPAVSFPPILYVAVAVLWGMTFLVIATYDPRRRHRVSDELQSVTLGTGLAALLFAGLLYLTFRNLSRGLFILFVFIDLVFLIGWRLAVRVVYKLRGVQPGTSRVLIVGAGRVGRHVGHMLREHGWMGLDLVGYLGEERALINGFGPMLGKVGDVRSVVEEKGIDDVVIALPQEAYGEINKLVLTLHDLPVNVRFMPDYFSLSLYRASVDNFGGLPMINLRDPALNEVQRLVKRLFDLAIGGLLTLTALPAMTVIAVAIKMDSPGPILFRQRRVGENGRIFEMLKFRSMVVGAEKMQERVNHVNGDGDLIHKTPDDPRTTRIGRFLRRTSLDELPQLLNVLKGEMSLVGPRPEMPWLVEKYEPWQHRRFSVPQGITGWWQINGRSSRPMHLHTEDDLFYVQNYSLLMDMYILLKTPFVVLRGKGAY